MHRDLEHLIRLQRLDLDTDRRRRTLEALPDRQAEAERLVEERTAAVNAARDRAAENQAARRAIEKDLAGQESRLSRFKDQLMQVKTNREYVAMQAEISTAEIEIKQLEDQLLQLMLASDEISASIAASEQDLRREQQAAIATTRQITSESARLDAELGTLRAERDALVREISPEAVALFDQLSRQRKGLALSEVRDGHCSACHVRLMPKVEYAARLNDQILRCESCHRILYSVPRPPGTAPDAEAADVAQNKGPA